MNRQPAAALLMVIVVSALAAHALVSLVAPAPARAVLALGRILPGADAQIIVALYSCDDTRYAQCDAEYKTCSSLRQAREVPEVGCKCWTDAFVCYSDCGRFPADWSSRCAQACPSDACSPPAFAG